jgi:hypothetical protein
MTMIGMPFMITITITITNVIIMPKVVRRSSNPRMRQTSSIVATILLASAVRATAGFRFTLRNGDV